MKNLTPGIHEYDYLLENKFFTDIDGDQVRKGEVKVHLTVNRLPMMFEMNFQIEGTVFVPCDRCLDDVDIPISTHSRLIVKFGKEYSEESDEIVIVPEEEGDINVAWFLYEFVSLAVPMKHVHAPGMCNKQMSSKLKRHTARSADDADEEYENTDEVEDTDNVEEESSADPRWDGLKGLLEDDNN